MGVDDVDIAEGFDLRQIEAEGLECAFELAFSAVGDLGPGFRATDEQVSLVGMLRAPAMHFHFDLTGEFAAQIIHVDSRAPVDLWGEFSREQADSHGLTSS